MYKGHFGDAPYYHLGDVWDTSGVLPHLERPTFLATASFPCTDLSLAGKWSGFDGEASSTYFGFINIIKALGRDRPKIIMLENVMGFLTSKGGADFARATKALASLGYWVDALGLDAKRFVPQSRPRIFVLGFHESLRSSRLIKQGRTSTLGDPWETAIDDSGPLRSRILRKLMAETTLATGWATLQLRPPRQSRYELSSVIDTDDQQEWWGKDATTKHYSMLSELHRSEVDRRRRAGGLHIGTVYRRCRNAEMRAEVRFDNVAGCLRTPRGGSARQIVLVIDEGRIRFRWMSPREYARLQGADNFVLPENTIQSLFGFGDGVCVPVIRWIDQHILSPLYDDAVAHARRRSTPR